MIRLDDPLALGLVIGGFVFGLAIGWLCGVTWTTWATLRRDAHVVHAANAGPLIALVARLQELRIRSIAGKDLYIRGDGNGL